MNERIIRMAEYSLKNDIYPEIVPITLDPDDEMFPEAVMNAKRVSDFMDAQTVRIDDDARFVGLLKFDWNIPGNIFQRQGHKYSAKSGKYYLKPQEALATYDAEHSNADFGMIINSGIEGIKERINKSRDKYAADTEKLFFLEGMEIALNGILRWSVKCAAECEKKAEETNDPERARELHEMAAICRRVPAKPAKNFREAIQCLYMCFHFLPDSIGAPDRYLRPFYEADIASGKITVEDAENYLGELFVMISAFTPYTSGHYDKGGESHFAIGGYLPDHTDGFSEFSRLILDTLMKLPLVRPQITVRWTPGMKHETLYHILDCERHDKGKRIALANDVPRIKAFEDLLGMSFEEACKYIIVGCNEPSFEGSIDLSGCLTNVGRSMTDTFADRRREIIAAGDFDEFYRIFEEELYHDLTRIIDYMNLFNAARARDINVISSPFISGCVERAASVNAGGAEKATFCASLCGYISVVDSLTIIKQFAFDEKVFTMEKLADMLAADWKGFDTERELILKKGHFFGNDYDDSDEILRRFNASLNSFAKKHRGVLGTKLMFGSYTGYWQHNVWFGELTDATPDGRHKGDPFVIGVGQTDGKDSEGMTALMNSAAAAFSNGAINGSAVFNLRLDETLIRNDEYFAKTVNIIESYFRKGGLMLQLNYVSREELLDAKKNPDAHRNLRVRVSGFSGYFTHLNEQLQDDVIARTEKKG